MSRAIFPNQQRFERAQDGCQAGSEKAFAETSKAFIRFNTNECPIEITLNHRGFLTSLRIFTLDFFRGDYTLHRLRCAVGERMTLAPNSRNQTTRIRNS